MSLIQNPSSEEVAIRFVRLDDTKSIIRLDNGDEYEVSVFEPDGAHGWKNITRAHNWESVAKEVSKLILEKTNQESFEKAEMILTGDFAKLESEKPRQRQIASVSGTIKFKDKNSQAQSYIFDSTTEAMSTEETDKFAKKLEAISKSFAAIATPPPPLKTQDPESHPHTLDTSPSTNPTPQPPPPKSQIPESMPHTLDTSPQQPAKKI